LQGYFIKKEGDMARPKVVDITKNMIGRFEVVRQITKRDY